MKMTIRCQGFDRTPAIEAYLEKRLLKLASFFANPERLTFFVKCSVQHDEQRTEVTLMLNDLTLRAEKRGPDLYATIDEVERRLIRQIHKYKTKLHRHVRSELPDLAELHGDSLKEESEHTDTPTIVKQKAFSSKPMSAEEAILEMNLLDHPFFVFQDAESGDTLVIYKRKDGNYGLITPNQAS